MSDKPEKIVVIISESLIASIIKDVFTFMLFGGLMYFNHKVLGGSTFIDVLFILIVMMYLMSRSSSKVFSGSKTKAIEWLKGDGDE